MAPTAPSLTSNELLELVETKGLIDWSLLPSVIDQRDSIRKSGDAFETRDMHGNRVSTADDSKIPAEFEGRVTKPGHFPADYDVDEFSIGDEHHTVDLVLRTAQECIAPSPKSLKPYPTDAHCDIWIRSRLENRVLNGCGCGERMDHFRNLKASWEKSKLRKKLVEDLQRDACKCNLRLVNRIVRLDLNELDKGLMFWEHLLAATIRDTLQHAGGTTSMQIIAHSKSYFKDCVDVLKDVLGITVVEQPVGFLFADRNTFVISNSFRDDRNCQWTLKKKNREVGGPAVQPGKYSQPTRKLKRARVFQPAAIGMDEGV